MCAAWQCDRLFVRADRGKLSADCLGVRLLVFDVVDETRRRIAVIVVCDRRRLPNDSWLNRKHRAFVFQRQKSAYCRLLWFIADDSPIRVMEVTALN